VTVKVPAVFAVNVGSDELVITGAPPMTLRVSACVAVPVPFTAVRFTVYVLMSDATGVPEMVAVPFPLSVNVKSAGRPDCPSDGVGYPVAATVKLNGLPVTAVAVDVLVIAGAEPTTTVIATLALGLIPLAAVTSSVTVPATVGVP
jgi:hypothetical protein